MRLRILPTNCLLFSFCILSRIFLVGTICIFFPPFGGIRGGLFAQSPPIAGFTTPDTGCTGTRTVNFQDLSTGVPDQWYWDFGDGTTDSVQNPLHIYSSDGDYSVSLIACNPSGCDTAAMNIILRGPIATNCSPGTTFICCNHGIYNVTFGGINSNSGSSAEGYKDFSCTRFTQVNAGQSVPIEVQTSNQLNENVVVWIDFNNDGFLDSISEKVFESLNKDEWHSGVIWIPDTAGVIGFTTLRMRVGSDNFVKPGPYPCSTSYYGQFEDYGIKIIPYPIPPTAIFSSPKSGCTNQPIIFYDNSSNLPTSWKWDFGDGSTSTAKNPSHSYADSGNYSISLVVTNSFGSDTLIEIAYLTIVEGPVASCTPIVQSSCCGTGVSRFRFAGIDNLTGDAAAGYQDFSCTLFTTVYTGSKQQLTVQTGTIYNENLKVWLDYNNDGSFSDSSELLFSHNGLKDHSIEIFMPLTNDTNTYLRMRAASDYGGITPPLACGPLIYGQTEDYGVRIYRSHFKPKADMVFSITDPCNKIVSFSDYSEFHPTSWIWNFGDGYTGIDSSTIHDYLYAGNYTVTLIASNGYGSDTITKTVTLDSVMAFFIATDTSYSGYNISFNNYSYGANSYSWSFGDGKTSTSVNPSHVYTTGGNYTVQLIASYTTTGCSDTAIHPIFIIGDVGIDELDFWKFDSKWKNGEIKISIFDILGRRVKVPVGKGLHAGIYFYTVFENNRVTRHGKLVVE